MQRILRALKSKSIPYCSHSSNGLTLWGGWRSFIICGTYSTVTVDKSSSEGHRANRSIPEQFEALYSSISRSWISKICWYLRFHKSIIPFVQICSGDQLVSVFDGCLFQNLTELLRTLFIKTFENSAFNHHSLAVRDKSKTMQRGSPDSLGSEQIQ